MRKSKAEGAPRRSFCGPILRVVLPFLIYGELREGIREKNGLLFELNHRSKNNLQIILEGHFDA
jgi:two-component sensor histidine kinase